MIDLLINIIYTSIDIIYTFLTTRWLTPDIIQILLSELQFMFGLLQDISRDIPDIPWLQRVIVQGALRALIKALTSLTSLLAGFTDPTLIICRNLAMSIVTIIKVIIRGLGGG